MALGSTQRRTVYFPTNLSKVERHAGHARRTGVSNVVQCAGVVATEGVGRGHEHHVQIHAPVDDRRDGGIAHVDILHQCAVRRIDFHDLEEKIE